MPELKQWSMALALFSLATLKLCSALVSTRFWKQSQQDELQRFGYIRSVWRPLPLGVIWVEIAALCIGIAMSLLGHKGELVFSFVCFLDAIVVFETCYGLLNTDVSRSKILIALPV